MLITLTQNLHVFEITCGISIGRKNKSINVLLSLYSKRSTKVLFILKCTLSGKCPPQNYEKLMQRAYGSEAVTHIYRASERGTEEHHEVYWALAVR